MTDIIRTLAHIRRRITRNDLFIILGLIILYAATRLIYLDRFPIFSDEGIYIHWAKVAWHDASWRFISLTDGKQPLQTWGTIPFLKLFPNNLLLGGRLFAVATGFTALCGTFSLMYYLFGKKAAYIGCLMYIFTPYFLFYDRMALVDSGVNSAFIWILLLSIVLARTQRLDISFLFGIVSGFGLLAKSSVQIFVGLSGLAPILFVEKNFKKFLYRAVNYYLLYGIGVVFAVLIYNIQRLSPFLHFVSEKNNTFVKTFAEFRADPFDILGRNLLLVPQYVFGESGYIISILGILGLFFLYRKHKRLTLYLTLWIIIPYGMVGFFSKVLFPRYIIFFASLLMVPAVYLISTVKKKNIVALIAAAFILSVGYFDYTIISDYKNIPFPPVDRGQYIEGWPAGWGMKEIIEFAREKSHDKPVILLAEGNFGLAGDVLDSLLKPSDTLEIRAYWPLDEKTLTDNQKDLDTHLIYIVLAHELKYPDNWPMKLIRKFDKPGNQSVTYLYELTR